MITRSRGILRLPRCAGCVAGVAAPRVETARGVRSCASPAGDASVRRVRTSDPKLNARLPRFTRAVAWLLAAVFGFVFPAHLGGSDHHVTHGHTHHTATAGAAAVPVIEACDPCAHQGEHDHHRGHDHQLLLPSKGGSHASKTVATATPIDAGRGRADRAPHVVPSRSRALARSHRSRGAAAPRAARSDDSRRLTPSERRSGRSPSS
jgi:hypothetical protein